MPASTNRPLGARPRVRRPSLAIVAVAITLQFACGGSSDTVPPPVVDATPTTLVAQSSANPAGSAGVALPSPIVVRVLNKAGAGVGGVVVQFSVPAGGGSVSATSVTSDAQGGAQTIWTLGPKAGPQTLVASAGDLAPVTFTATAAAGAAATMLKIDGDGQTAAAGAALLVTPAVQVLDATGNPVAGVAISFQPLPGSGSVASSAAITDVNGIARAGTWTLARTAVVNSLRAVAGTLSVIFAATGLPGAPATVVFQSAALTNLRLGDTARVTAIASDVYGNIIPAAPITFAATPAGHVTLDPTGKLTVLVAGPFRVSATASTPSGTAATASVAGAAIGRPVGAAPTVSLALGALASLAITDDEIVTVIGSNRGGLLTRFNFDGVQTRVVDTLATAAKTFVVLAPRGGGGTAVVANTGYITGTYWFVDLASNTIVDSITTKRYVLDGVLNASGTRAFFLLDAGELAVLDVPNHRFLPSIQLGAGIDKLKLAYGDTTVYARSSVGTMLMIDLQRGVVTRQFSMAAYADLDVSPDQSAFYVLDDPLDVIRILRASDLAQIGAAFSEATSIAVSPDGQAIFVNVPAFGSVSVLLGTPQTGFRAGLSFPVSGLPPRRILFSRYGDIALSVSADGFIDIIR